MDVSFWQDKDGKPWIGFGGDGMACLDGSLARRIHDKYPLCPQNEVESEFGPLTELRPVIPGGE